MIKNTVKALKRLKRIPFKTEKNGSCTKEPKKLTKNTPKPQ
jgi:hypothetical protein